MTFHLRGPLDPHDPLFVGRAAELARIDLWLRHGDAIGAVLGGRQNGKTSVLLRARDRARAWQQIAFVDFQGIAGADPTTCARYVAEQVLEQIVGPTTAAAPPLPEGPGGLQRFMQAMGGMAPTARIGLFLDELGVLPDETRRWLGSALRAAFNLRLVHPSLQRWTFVLAGGIELCDMAVHRNSPLRNVLDEIYLGDLSMADVESLLGASERGARLSPHAEAIYAWTGGHPYLTQALAEEALRTTSIDDAAAALLRSEAHNLPHALHAIAREGLEPLFRRIVAGDRVEFIRLDERVARLELLGVIKEEAGACRPRNALYAEATTGRHLVAPGGEPLARPRIAQRRLVFVSYSHEDDRWQKLLRQACAPFKDRVELWSDQDIPTGARWRDEIEAQLSQAKVAVLLVSAAFLASRFVTEVELPKILKRHQQDGLTVLWLAVSDSAFSESDIAGFQAVSDPKLPLDQMRLPRAKAAVVALSRKVASAASAGPAGDARPVD
jgi:hypothetical protein